MTLAREVERELLHTGMTKTVGEKSPNAGERWRFGYRPSYKAGGLGFSKHVQQQFRAQTDWVGANKEKVQSKVGNTAQKEIQRLPAPPLMQNKNQQQFFNKSRGTRHLSHQEFDELRTKGLFYRCKQPYHPMHTMKIRGRLKGHELTVMVDSGASHNFIANNLVTQLGLPVQSTPTFGVKLGDGHRSKSRGMCTNLVVKFESFNIQTDCYLFPLGGVDMILGIAWLETLGDVKVNWAKMTMSFNHNGSIVSLTGDSSLTRALASVSSIEKLDDVEYYTLL
ncbi:hypothetical protein GH714_012679 [Hevea brasiliensis]|uniref:Aspartic peptidase DDI1-type domain-containing protein n=1 Tax=Hevea brasiliensis TaxID=3981 RepID=A0A6A6NGT5_HEVBR|nr:hypothetical protein GH714_012679 [Hevea brasiliensis]